MDIGREIRQRREAKGWSQAKLAGASDMGVSGISQIETGARNPSVVTLSKIAEALGVDVADLFPKAQSSLPLDSWEPKAEQDQEWRRIYRQQLLRELRQHVSRMSERFEREIARLAQDGSAEDWAALLQEASFASLTALYVLRDTDEEAGALGGASETELLARESVEHATKKLDAICDQLGKIADAARSNEGGEEAADVRLLFDLRQRRAG